jgi:hypothetical protein
VYRRRRRAVNRTKPSQISKRGPKPRALRRACGSGLYAFELVSRCGSSSLSSGLSRMRWRAASANLGWKGGDEMPPIATRHEPPSCLAVMRHALEPTRQQLIVYSINLPWTSASYPFGRETFSRREDAERFIEEVRGDDPALASASGRGARARGGRAELEPRLIPRESGCEVSACGSAGHASPRRWLSPPSLGTAAVGERFCSRHRSLGVAVYTAWRARKRERDDRDHFAE